MVLDRTMDSYPLLFAIGFAWIASSSSILPSLYDCRTRPSAPIVCSGDQFTSLSPFCSGEASVCEAVTSSNLTLICSSCSSANTVIWRLNSSSQSLPYNTYIAQIPARDVQPDASGCYTCVCDGNSYSFAVDIRAAECPYLLVRNETKHNESYLYPKNVETELTDNSTGILTVNCTSSGWPTPRIDWIVAIRGIVRRSYELPNYNVTENGQVLAILFPSLEEIERQVVYACNVMNVVGHFFVEQIIEIKAVYGYFLKPHESQTHGAVPVLNGQEGVAYCAVNPEDGVGINYTVCAYHGTQTDLDWVASPFIANDSSDCCLCGQCGEGVLGLGVTAIDELSPPNSNNFSVPACQVRSETAVDGSFVCLAHRVTGGQPSAKQALALFHFQPPMPTAVPNVVAISVLSVVLGVMTLLFVASLVALLVLLCKKRKKDKKWPRSGSYKTREVGAASGEGLQAAYQQTEGVALSVDGTGNKGERNEVANLPAAADATPECAQTETHTQRHVQPAAITLFEKVQKQQTAFIEGLKLDGKLLGLLHQHQLLTQKEFNDINAYHLRQHIPDAGTYFVNSVMFQWSKEVFESKARGLIKALEKHEDASNHKLASRLREAFEECGLAVPCVEDST